MAAVFREEAGRLTAALVRSLRDFDLAEECVQDALVAALEHWPSDGVPENPGAWLMTTARRKGIDRLRRDKRYQEKTLELAKTVELVMGADMARQTAQLPDERLELIFTCCHPAVLYLMFNEGYLSTGERGASDRDLASEAEWLTSLVAELLPDEPEVLGLLALMRLNLARAAARFDGDGNIVLLRDQERWKWDRERIDAAIAIVGRFLRIHRPGPYQLQALIALAHADAPSWEETRWPEIVEIYDRMLAFGDSAVVRLNRAIAVSHVAGPGRALSEVDTLALDLDRYHLFHATRAEMLRELGRTDEARLADRRALELTENPAERALLQRRLA